MSKTGKTIVTVIPTVKGVITTKGEREERERTMGKVVL